MNIIGIISMYMFLAGILILSIQNVKTLKIPAKPKQRLITIGFGLLGIVLGTGVVTMVIHIWHL